MITFCSQILKKKIFNQNFIKTQNKKNIYKMPTKKEVKKTKSGKIILNIKLKKGGLAGYRINDPVKQKKQVLDKLVKKDGYSTIIKRLNILAIYNKNKNPSYTAKVRKDISYLQNKYRGKSIKVSKPKTRTKSPRIKPQFF